MYKLKRLSKSFQLAPEIPFDDSSRIVLMSDCHRGDGSWADNFSKNENLYFAALTYYNNKDYTYIELGDGDELWENNRLSEIMQIHSNAFWLLYKFFKENRLYFIYGNHDMIKRSNKYIKNNLYYFFDEREKQYVPLFENIKVYEGLVLKHSTTGNKIFLIHGHQVDFMNYILWRVTRFLVRYLWKPLELFGVNDVTRTAKNYKKKELAERKLIKWVDKENQMLIAGHTHRPVFPEVGDTPYFNDGSCVHPHCITGIEISDGSIQLIKWEVKTRNDGTLFVGREVLAGPKKLKDYFTAEKMEK